MLVQVLHERHRQVEQVLRKPGADRVEFQSVFHWHVICMASCRRESFRFRQQLRQTNKFYDVDDGQ